MERKGRKETVSPLHLSTKRRLSDSLPHISQYEEARSRTPDVPPPPNAEVNHHGAQPLPINFGMLMRHVDEHLRQVDDHLNGLQRQPVPLHAIEILSSDDEDYSPTEDEYE